MTDQTGVLVRKELVARLRESVRNVKISAKFTQPHKKGTATATKKIAEAKCNLYSNRITKEEGISCPLRHLWGLVR